ncbi:Putative NADPH-quinone reductase (modulator of drug activity B) [Desemzia incerta]|uniref:Putative NADPH-quinone reductase (Modulator of drug activity B) n=1 Tax=Desemzia incerta TaxID=82801 RepID=A0A1I5X8R2_9LACT|nr:NAD(P)H-dependent oxidoreductase [Desemzia incerta]SFQ28369.1 Putative NADPH-quinone reductase (modulator of drug activity B) [Desemzia incerta]
MKTLVVISHPEISESGSQQFLLSSIPESESVKVHHLEGVYPDSQIDVAAEQELLKQFDRILFQFPFYWYSSPPLLKQWQDEVLTYGFAYGKNGHALSGKEFGLVLSVGIKESEYQAGGKEVFSINELTKPFQAVAVKTGMTYLKPFVIYQFPYMTEEQKMTLLIDYQQAVTREADDSLATREKWIIQELEKTPEETLAPGDELLMQHAVDLIEENRDTIDGLKMVLDEMNS